LDIGPGDEVRHVVDTGAIGEVTLLDSKRPEGAGQEKELRDVRTDLLAGEVAAEEERGGDVAAVFWSLVVDGGGELCGCLLRDRVGVVAGEGDVAKQGAPIKLDELGGVLLAGEPGRRIDDAIAKRRRSRCRRKTPWGR
jgi:hypothetical protein